MEGKKWRVLQRSSTFVNCIFVRFYETDCRIKEEINKMNLWNYNIPILKTIYILQCVTRKGFRSARSADNDTIYSTVHKQLFQSFWTLLIPGTHCICTSIKLNCSLFASMYLWPRYVHRFFSKHLPVSDKNIQHLIKAFIWEHYTHLDHYLNHNAKTLFSVIFC